MNMIPRRPNDLFFLFIISLKEAQETLYMLFFSSLFFYYLEGEEKGRTERISIMNS